MSKDSVANRRAVPFPRDGLGSLIIRFLRVSAVVIVTGMVLNGCISSSSRDNTGVYDVARAEDMDRLAGELAGNRAVLVGETHTRVDHHDLQLAVIDALRRSGADLAIGVEWFQHSFQDDIDDFLAGRIDEAELLHRTGYFERWRYDYRLYQPIVRYARDNGIPLLALNAPKELTDAVSKRGVDGVPRSVRSQLPESYDRSNSAYEESLRQVFEAHDLPADDDRFANFVDVQLTWDETMAEQAARYLAANPEKTLVVLAGNGHVVYGHGIPSRLERRLDGSVTTVVAAELAQSEPGSADFFVVTRAEELPPSGLLGIFLRRDDQGLLVDALSEDSGAREAGLVSGDRLVRVDGRDVPHLAALKLALMTHEPGESVPVEYARADPDGMITRYQVDVTLR
jgi:uncharacterized iron-regulated protein